MRDLMTPINTPDEQFHGGNPSKGDACTVVTAKWLNDVQAAVRSNQDELLTILQAAVIDADSDKKDQVLDALSKLFIRRSNGIGYYATVPAQQAEPIVYVPPFGLMHWLESIKAYRSVDCGAIILHPSATLRAGTIKANGATLNKADYAGLWSWAQENSVVVANASWAAGTAFYADVNATTFKVPDLRGEFLRAWDDGRGADVSRQICTWQNGTHITGDNDVAPSVQGIGQLPECNTDVGDGIARTIYYIAPTSIVQQGNIYWGRVRPRNMAMLACIKY